MRTKQPQFKEAGNERCVYVFREQGDGTPTNLDDLRGIQLDPDEKIIILVMNTDDMLISYSDNARSLVDAFELELNQSYEATTHPFGVLPWIARTTRQEESRPQPGRAPSRV